MFRVNPPAYAQYNLVSSRNSFDSAAHRVALALCPRTVQLSDSNSETNGKMLNLKGYSSLAALGNFSSFGTFVNFAFIDSEGGVEGNDEKGGSAKLEPAFANLERLDPGLKSRAWNSKFGRGAGGPGDPASTFRKRGLNDFAFFGSLGFSRRGTGPGSGWRRFV
jgi:hypothetical protein